MLSAEILYPNSFAVKAIPSRMQMLPKGKANMTEKTVCIIPARGGSKRVPRKNIRPLSGKPLLAYTIEAAIDSDCFVDVYVSSDDSEILHFAEEFGAKTDQRPQELGGDTVKAVEVIYQFVQRPDWRNKWDNVAMCMPTTPFRTAEDVRNAMTLFLQEKEKCPRLVGVTECDVLPQFVLERIPGTSMVDMREPESYKGSTRSQDYGDRYFFINGSIYVSTIKEYLKAKTFFGRPMLSSVLPMERAFDIDSLYQFKIAEIMMSEKMRSKEAD